LLGRAVVEEKLHVAGVRSLEVEHVMPDDATAEDLRKRRQIEKRPPAAAPLLRM